MTTSPSRWQRHDTLLLAALLAVSCLSIALQVHWSWTPMEDAAMLLRYSQNLAAGHGIRWSLNQAPIDGATDFLYMVLTAALARLAHLDVVTASRWINILAQTTTVALLYPAARRLGGGRWLSAAAALYLIAGPFNGLTDACFGTPLFALFLMLCWSAGLRYALQRASWPNALRMAIFGLLAGLTRPEGVLIAAFILLATLYLANTTPDRVPHLSTLRGGLAASVPAIISYLALFGLLGGAYFLWHWHYFGYPLPNPFYIKGDGHLYPQSVKHAAINVVSLLLPALPLIPLGWLAESTRRLTNALLLVLLPFTLMWVLLTNANNHFLRFQYALVPLVLMTVPTLARGLSMVGAPPLDPALWLRSASPLQRNALRLAATLAVLGTMLYSSRTTRNSYTAWGMRTFALRLQPLADRGYTMAVTEAGALPLYSQWNVIDGLGLNDAYIAHHHQRLDAAYLDRYHPEVIMVHLDRLTPAEYLPGGLALPPPPDSPSYNLRFLNYYASTHDYTLAAIWGADQCNLHLYWLRNPSPALPFPDFATVLSDIRDHPYNFLDNGFLSHDFRNDLASLPPCAAPEGPQGREQ